MSRPRVHKAVSTGGFELTGVGDARIRDVLGEGGRSTVYDAEWNDREVALKVYKSRAVERHARRHDKNLARFEYERNLAFYQAPGMAGYVAEPLAFLHDDGVSAFLQEKLDGELYYFYYQSRKGDVPPVLFAHVERIVQLSHQAELYDIDLHSMNLIVCETDEGPIPKLFDFNLIPFHERPRNPLIAFLLATRLMSPRSRDLRLLRDFHNFKRVESRLLQYYEDVEPSLRI